jgi:hypothetical protein
MNLIVYFSMSWVKLGDLLNGYLGICIITKYNNNNNKPFLEISLSN